MEIQEPPGVLHGRLEAGQRLGLGEGGLKGYAGKEHFADDTDATHDERASDRLVDLVPVTLTEKPRPDR